MKDKRIGVKLVFWVLALAAIFLFIAPTLFQMETTGNKIFCFIFGTGLLFFSYGTAQVISFGNLENPQTLREYHVFTVLDCYKRESGNDVADYYIVRLQNTYGQKAWFEFKENPPPKHFRVVKKNDTKEFEPFPKS